MKTAKHIIDKDYPLAPVDRRLFGTFIEPIRDIIYGNLYNPNHPVSDANGFRTDVLELMRELKTTVIRYPGGNYVSNYHWADGIGPREDRPVRYDKAWRTIDNNHIGIDEYYDYCQWVGAEPMLAVNLGTGSPEEAADEVEYCNMPGGTTWSDLRKKNGHDQPQGIQLWCLGNEMDGPWQVAQKTPQEYGRIAQEAAKMMRWVDPDIELVACGSCTNEPFMPTYPEWDRIVLDLCYENVDYLSLHRYLAYDPKVGGAFTSPFTIEDLPYISLDLQDYINTVLAAADFIKGKRRSDKSIGISFDEWGVRSSFNVEPEGLSWTEKAVTENQAMRVTNVIDALVYGSILITFLNRCDRVKIACESIVIGGMIAATPDGGAYRQTTFYPFVHAATYGHGVTMRPNLDSPMVKTDIAGELPAVQIATVYNEDEGTLTVFAVNLNLREDIELNSDFRSFGGNVTLAAHIQLHEDQPLAGNTYANPDRVIPKNIPVKEGEPVVLPRLSWNVLRYQIG